MNRGSSLLFCIACLLIPGCGEPKGVVSGSVTYKGEPVANGAITFYPEEQDAGPASGAMIVDGKYACEDLTPGRKMVQIVGSLGAAEAVVVPHSTEDFMKQSEATGDDQPSGPDALIPADAVGNCSTVEVKEGEQTLDFHLKEPGA